MRGALRMNEGDMEMKVQGRGKKGKPKRRRLDRARDRATWRLISSYIDPT